MADLKQTFTGSDHPGPSQEHFVAQVAACLLMACVANNLLDFFTTTHCRIVAQFVSLHFCQLVCAQPVVNLPLSRLTIISLPQKTFIVVRVFINYTILRQQHSTQLIDSIHDNPSI